MSSEDQEYFKKIPLEYLIDLYISESGKIKDPINKKYYEAFKSNYDRVVLPLKNKKRMFFSIHRLVAISFIPNDDITKTQVNHKDGNKKNNHYTNLEWVSPKENVNHSLKNGLSKGRSVAVRCLNPKTNEIIGEFKNIKLASIATHSNDRHISDVCKGKRLTCGGFKWEYADVDYSLKNSIPIDEPDGMIYKNYDNYIFTDNGMCFSIKSKKYLNLKETPSGSVISLCFNGEKKDFLVHRIIAELYLKKEMVRNVKHIDGNKFNNKVENLVWY